MKINLNCFHTTPERDFSLSMFPDIYARYAAASRFVLDRGYQPIWIEDGFFGGAA